MASHKIISIEDSAITQEELRVMFSEYDCEILTAGDGEAGLELILANLDARLIIIDYEMPKKNGLDLVEDLKTKVKEPPPIVFLTAEPKSERTERAKQLGVRTWIVKPLQKTVVDKLASRYVTDS